MNYAIIAAGEGSRLVKEGIQIPKPLVKLHGITLIDRLISIFLKNKADSISIIINEEMKEVQEHIEKIRPNIPFHIVIKSTPGSMHSFFELSKYLQNGKFCLTTVDTIFKEDDFSKFIRAFEQDTVNDGLMAVTSHIDDEKPLYISVDENTMMIRDFLDKPVGGEKYVSGGIYGLTSKSLPPLYKCLENGMLRMRHYQRRLIADGLQLKAFPFDKIIDVDHADDLKKAEDFLDEPPKLHIAAIRRGNQYSPNHIGNDTAIFNLTMDCLREKNCEVTAYSEQEFQNTPVSDPIIFNMARDIRTISKLQYLEAKGKKVINSGHGINNCTRVKMTQLLLDNRIPYPKSLIVSTNEPLPEEAISLGDFCWVKRGDSHAIHYEDVAYTGNGREAENILSEFALRGISSAVLSEHLKGDLVKFYGVKNTEFFYWFYPNDLNHSKFGLEAINGKATGIPFDLEYLKEICTKAAEILSIYIYGGDCVVDPTGNISIIDFNDWPSFAPCRAAAAPYIAQCIYEFATK
ncbi:MAG: NTP transferase domain-containing protein [Dysgonamonadaceae bacterium]|jgi:NDP-sugar pyrophosphorylase family protein|nr:NTP transferase domain-containing protein [Dysgonamonadaceae bacterium]